MSEEEEKFIMDTQAHVNSVRAKMSRFMVELGYRARVHDASKFTSPEKEVFIEYGSKLKDSTYGSDEYKKNLEEMQVALKAHYERNSHHPEHYDNGIDGMNLFDIVEMFCDWKVAVERHDDGDIYRSIEINRERFNMSDQLVNIFKNTLKDEEERRCR